MLKKLLFITLTFSFLQSAEQSYSSNWNPQNAEITSQETQQIQALYEKISEIKQHAIIRTEYLINALAKTGDNKNSNLINYLKQFLQLIHEHQFKKAYDKLQELIDSKEIDTTIEEFIMPIYDMIKAINEICSKFLGDKISNKEQKFEFPDALASIINEYALAFYTLPFKELISRDHENEGTRSVAWSANNQHIIASGPAWSTRHSTKTCRIPDSSDLLENVITMWNFNTGQKITTFLGHHDWIRKISWSQDNKYIVSESNDNIIKIWDTQTGQEIPMLKGPFLNQEPWSLRNKYLALGTWWHPGDNVHYIINIYDTQTKKLIKILDGHSNRICKISWSIDNKYLASSSNDKTIIIWDFKTRQKIHTLQADLWANPEISWSNDNKYIATCCLFKDYSIKIKIWDIETGQVITVLHGLNNCTDSICWSPDSRYIASGLTNGTIMIWDIETGQVIQKLPCQKTKLISWLQNGQLITNSNDGKITIWDELYYV